MKFIFTLLCIALAPPLFGVQVLRDSAANEIVASGVDEATTSSGQVEVRDGRLFFTPEPGHVGTVQVHYLVSSDRSSRELEIDVRAHPNFLFILTDDQSWTCLSARMDQNLPGSASDYHQTPNIDRLLESGMRFSRGYSPAPNCSPTRYANLTGKTCARLKFTDIVGRGHTRQSIGQKLIPINKATRKIREEDTTIPELLKSLPGADYATAHVGKWHLAGGGPEKHGFDVSDGATSNREGNRGPVAIDDPKLVFHIAKRGNAFMEEAASSRRPFYCQLSHYAVHAKIQHRPETLAKIKKRKVGNNHQSPEYAAMVSDLDTSVGLVLDKLDELGLRHSTYVIYQADNGAPQFLSNAHPLKRYKPEIWEGGTRVPTIISGPGITAGSQCDQAVMGIDILPTIWELAGGKKKELPENLDGGSLAPVLQGKSQKEITRPGEVVLHSPHYVLTKDLAKNQRPSSALHRGPWKLVAWYETGEVLLYNLQADPGETTDVSAKNPEEKRHLWKLLRDYLSEVDAQMPTLDPSHASNKGAQGDADADGLPDAWEIKQLLTFALGPNDDPDGDGHSNLEEQREGTDPLAPPAAPKPDIIHIIADDLGWNDVGFHGSEIPTPNLDKLAAESIVLDRFYVSPICSPTRAGALTGRYPFRFGIWNGVCNPKARHGIPPEEITVPELLAKAGYKERALIGKWHLGLASTLFHPLNHGFTEFYGHYNGAIDYFSRHRFGQLDWHRNFDPVHEEGYSTDLLGKAAAEFIGRQEAPYYLLVAFNAPHSPIQATPEDLEACGFDPDGPRAPNTDAGLARRENFPAYGESGKGNTKRQTFAAMTRAMDRNIGLILEAIEKRGRADNTLIVFHSDNGATPTHGGSNAPLRGNKFSTWEGGTRVVALLRWPEKFQGGTKFAAPAAYIDLLPTFAAAGGVDAPQTLDGINLLPSLSGETTAPDRTLLLGQDAVVSKRWKLKGEELFDLEADPHETKDLAAAHPDQVRKLQAARSTFPKLTGPKVPSQLPLPEAWPPVEWKLPDEPR